MYKKTLVFAILFILTFTSIYGLEYNYVYKVNSIGETTSFIFLYGQDIVNIKIPKDVQDPGIRGGIYIQNKDIIELSIDDSKEAVVAYKSFSHINKRSGIWYFETNVRQNSNVTLLLPNDATIIQTTPRTKVKNQNNNKMIFWENITEKNITVSYFFENIEIFQDLNDSENNYNGIFFGLILIFIIGIITYFAFKKKEIKTEPKNISDNQLNIIRAANVNDALIIKEIIKNNGHIKRNVLEKETKLSKSSLASSLNNLEKKNIVEIDRNFHIHYIKLSDWFNNL